MIAKRLITPAFDNVVSALCKAEYCLCARPFQIQTSQLSLTADPIVQMVMKADHVTEQQLMELIGGTLSKLAAGSQTER